MTSRDSRTRLPAFVLGGTGYVAGELLRLIAAHPQLELKAVLSDSQPGEPVAKSFRASCACVSDAHVLEPRRRHAARELAAEVGGSVSRAAWRRRKAHRRSAEGGRGEGREAARHRHLRRLSLCEPRRVRSRVQACARRAARIAQFTCAVPEHLDTLHTPHVAHPGCFATAVLLASVPLLKLGLVEPRLFVAGVTGSTGSGRTPGAGHASSAAPQRSVRVQPAFASAHAGDQGARARRL